MELITILTPLAIGTLLIVIYNQHQALKRSKLQAQLAQSKYQLLLAVQSELPLD
ncbi:hypothetical protein [Variovorax sp. RO1]|uniref:hypothetical protein n=1 Tax=Variovorax sp. RO1 TaxID=2066034 RepID=UPI0015DD9546|nr:hypothetical protein [Variovorax sp. RO1]